MRERGAGKWRKFHIYNIQRTTHVCKKGHHLLWKRTETRYLCKKCNEYYEDDGHGKIIKFKLEGDE